MAISSLKKLGRALDFNHRTNHPASEPGNASALFNVLTENDGGGVPRSTENALEEAQ